KGCPYCAGKRAIKGETDLATVNPLLASEWDYEKNEGLLPDMVTVSSTKNVWWCCGNCGSKWFTSPYKRSRANANCPKCKNRIF
ncbi:MAG: zinc-ribbon domain-containing protein, partial [Firmicutes bacterium]|nr:zinc-ribbon domain-containing protein [Bacillota bacterium]